MTLLLIFLFGAMTISFLCSILESVLMSTPLSYITMREDEGYKGATLFKKYKTDNARAIAAILSLNTIANTIGAAGVGHQVEAAFGNQWFGLVSAVTTVLILVFSEIIPKTIGTSQWRRLMGFTAYTIRVLIFVLYPVVMLVQWFTKLIAKKVIKLNNIKAYDVMTPRVVAATAPEKMTLKAFYRNDEYSHFSRIPVYAEEEDFITGYVLRSEALEELAEDHFSKTLGEIKRTIPLFNEEMSVADIWDSLLKHKEQIGGIIDEFGSFQGIITLEDIIETIFGLEIIDESDEVADMQQYARERWQQRQRRFKEIKLPEN